MFKDKCPTLVPIFVQILFILILAVTPFVFWILNLATFVRFATIFAVIFAALVFVTTAVIIGQCGFTRVFGEHRDCGNLTCCILHRYSPAVFISAAIFILAGLTTLAVALAFPLIGKIIIAAIAVIAFAIMVVEFVTMLYNIIARP